MWLVAHLFSINRELRAIVPHSLQHQLYPLLLRAFEYTSGVINSSLILSCERRIASVKSLSCLVLSWLGPRVASATVWRESFRILFPVLLLFLVFLLYAICELRVGFAPASQAYWSFFKSCCTTCGWVLALPPFTSLSIFRVIECWLCLLSQDILKFKGCGLPTFELVLHGLESSVCLSYTYCYPSSFCL